MQARTLMCLSPLLTKAPETLWFASMGRENIDFKKLPGGTISLSMRANEEIYNRLNAVAGASRRTIASLIAICVEDHLPILEKELGIKPGKPAKMKTVV